MYKIAFILLGTLMPLCSFAQRIVDGFPRDSTIIRFSTSDSSYLIPDTARSPLWQIGLTHKTFFTTDTFGTTAMMTDTVHHYPINANNWFIIKVANRVLNPIVDFWHKYQTDSFHSGGTVEFSLDTGVTWQNVKGPCNVDDRSFSYGVLTSNFYASNDTLNNGIQAFMGQSSGLQYSRIQFFSAMPAAKTTASGCDLRMSPIIYLRFRFLSDSTIDSLAGWMIDSIKIENDEYRGGITQQYGLETLNIYPNPSSDGTYTLPELEGESKYTIDVYNAMGMKVRTVPYSQKLDLSSFPKGVYFYTIGNGAVYYSGHLLN